MPRKLVFQLDWLTILLFLALVSLGWMNIFSTTLAEEEPNLLDSSKFYGKQLTYIILSLVLIVLVLSIEAKFYQRFASIIYVLAVLSLVGLLFFGKTIAGQTAWYSFGSFSIQPAEFVKPAVALAIAKYLTGINVSLKNFTDQVKTLLLMGIPVGLIMLQPDAGSAMIYAAFIIPLYREGLPDFYLIIGFLVVALFISTLGLGSVPVIITIVLITVLLWYFRRNKKTSIWPYVLISSACIVFTFSVNFIFLYICIINNTIIYKVFGD
jgi:rod shape determining protein RodA